MGCCISKSGKPNANHISRWRSTGVVALSDRKLKFLPDEVLELEKSVRALDLSHNRLVEIPRAIERLSNMQRLRLGDSLTRLRINLEMCQKLKLEMFADFFSLDRTSDYGHYTSIGMELFLRKSGEILDPSLARDRADAWESSIVEMSKIRHLSLGDGRDMVLEDNLIQYLPSNLGKLHTLKVLKLDGNQITSLPDELGLLVRLEKLSISRNLLTRLPETIGSLRNLLLLDVSSNKLKSLPESIGSCFSLEELQANENSIEELPSSICNLTHLKSLYLNKNKVHQVPPNLLKDCKFLQNISLHENPISMEHFQQIDGFQEFESTTEKKI